MASASGKNRSKSTAIALSGDSMREFRKTNEAIGLRVAKGSLSLLTRKLFNVMIFHAQDQKVPGVRAPINSPTSDKYFWVPLSDFAKDAAYNSKDVKFLKEQLEQLQNIKLVLEDEREWTSESLVASVKFVNPNGLKKHTGQVWIGFAFPPETHELVMSPGTYTRFSILYQSQLKSGSALALYEICRRYATNPSHLTMTESVMHWYGVLTGNPVTEEVIVPYKYFKRDVIKPSIAEVNQLTDIEVELIEHKNGRRIERLQFKVNLKAQSSLPLSAPPVIDTALMDRIEAFGFSQAEAADMLAAHGDTKVRGCVQLVEARMQQKNSPQLSSPAAYFKWSLREGDAAVRTLQLEEAKPAGRKKTQEAEPKLSLMDRFLSARADEALAVYREHEEDERRRILDRFRAVAPSGVPRGKGIENAMVRSLFARWYAMELWGEPTAEHLARFADRFELAA